MSFDEEVERTLDLLTDRLRDDVARHVRSAAGELAAVLRAERKAMEPPPAEPPPAPVESLLPSATTDPWTGRLAESIRAINDARSLSDILDTLVSRASLETSRVAVVLVRGDRFEGWRLRGFDAAIADAVPLDIASADAGIILQVAQTAMSAHNGRRPSLRPAAARRSMSRAAARDRRTGRRGLVCRYRAGRWGRFTRRRRPDQP